MISKPVVQYSDSYFQNLEYYDILTLLRTATPFLHSNHYLHCLNYYSMMKKYLMSQPAKMILEISFVDFKNILLCFLQP